MSRPSRTRTIFTARRVKIGAAATLGAALLVGAWASSADAATLTMPASSSPHSAPHSFGAEFRAEFRANPAALKADLAALKAMPHGASRTAQAKSIHASELSGKYGAVVEARTAWLDNNQGQKLRPVPANLKAAFASLKTAPKADRAKDREAIAAKAVEGDFGANIESFAKAVKAQHAWTTRSSQTS